MLTSKNTVPSSFDNGTVSVFPYSVLPLYFQLSVAIPNLSLFLVNSSSLYFSIAICAAGLKRLKFVSILDGSKSKNARLTVRMLKTGMPVGIMSMVTAVGGMILQFFVNDLGASAVAAYAASTKIRSVIGEFSNALGMTFMTFVGQNYGAQKYDRIKAGVRMGVLLSILIHIPLSAQLKYRWICHHQRRDPFPAENLNSGQWNMNQENRRRHFASSGKRR